MPKSYDDGRLSVMEALDLLRAMGRETTLEQVGAAHGPMPYAPMPNAQMPKCPNAQRPMPHTYT